MDVPLAKEGKGTSTPPGSTGPQKRTAGTKLPMPPEDELEERFSAVLREARRMCPQQRQQEVGAGDRRVLRRPYKCFQSDECNRLLLIHQT
ncbi:hypothetical protein F2P81_022746 [Scophthalmus maximus]|uniref:Uncharacterized protein n=1 Tax=Scophthalmus maximus TaxID=52904 RepID=A0A6A4S0V3_SCOMX|nr:hypothetical protein F2P81_022746 [Scophthalmus maximus]